MDDFIRTILRYGLRMITPGFAVTAILTFALGIGANTAIFRMAYIPLLRQPPYLRPEQPATLDEGSSQLSEDAIASSHPRLPRLEASGKELSISNRRHLRCFPKSEQRFLRGERC